MPQEALPSQLFLEIEDFRDDVVVLKTKGLRKILLVSGANTELMSEEEQSVIYLAFQQFLNSLDFSLQLITHSRRLNIEEYLKFLDERKIQETNELLRAGIEDYAEFIKSFVKENDIMTKNFFAVVPYDPIVIPKGKEIKGTFFGIFGKKEKPQEETPEEEEEYKKNLEQLNQRVDQITTGLRAINLRTVVLNNEELTELFYNLYNPKFVERKKMVLPQE